MTKALRSGKSSETSILFPWSFRWKEIIEDCKLEAMAMAKNDDLAMFLMVLVHSYGSLAQISGGESMEAYPTPLHGSSN